MSGGVALDPVGSEAVALAERAALTSKLSELGLGEHAVAIINQGLITIHALLCVNEDQEEDVQELLRDRNAPRESRRCLSRWLREQRVILLLRPPPGSRSAHFYGLWPTNLLE